MRRRRAATRTRGSTVTMRMASSRSGLTSLFQSNHLYQFDTISQPSPAASLTRQGEHPGSGESAASSRAGTASRRHLPTSTSFSRSSSGRSRAEEEKEWGDKLLGRRGKEGSLQSADCEEDTTWESHDQSMPEDKGRSSNEFKTLLDVKDSNAKTNASNREEISVDVAIERKTNKRAVLTKAHLQNKGTPIQGNIGANQPRKKSMEEWENRLTNRKPKKSAVDRIIEKNKKDSLTKSLTVSVDDLLDLEYQSVHASRNPLRRQRAEGEGVSHLLLQATLITAQKHRQRRFADTRPKSCDSAHLRTGRKTNVEVDSADETTSFIHMEKLSRRKKSKSENLSEDQRFSENDLGRHRKIAIVGENCKGLSSRI